MDPTVPTEPPPPPRSEPAAELRQTPSPAAPGRVLEATDRSAPPPTAPVPRAEPAAPAAAPAVASESALTWPAADDAPETPPRRRLPEVSGGKLAAPNRPGNPLTPMSPPSPTVRLPIPRIEFVSAEKSQGVGGFAPRRRAEAVETPRESIRAASPERPTPDTQSTPRPRNAPHSNASAAIPESSVPEGREPHRGPRPGAVTAMLGPVTTAPPREAPPVPAAAVVMRDDNRPRAFPSRVPEEPRLTIQRLDIQVINEPPPSARRPAPRTSPPSRVATRQDPLARHLIRWPR